MSFLTAQCRLGPILTLSILIFKFEELLLVTTPAKNCTRPKQKLPLQILIDPLFIDKPDFLKILTVIRFLNLQLV